MLEKLFSQDFSVLWQKSEPSQRDKVSESFRQHKFQNQLFSIHKICDQLTTIPLLTRLLHYHRKVFNNVLLSFIRSLNVKFRLLKIFWDFYYRGNLLSKFTAESEAGHQQLSPEFNNGEFSLLEQAIYRFEWVKILKTISRENSQSNRVRGQKSLTMLGEKFHSLSCGRMIQKYLFPWKGIVCTEGHIREVFWKTNWNENKELHSQPTLIPHPPDVFSA